MGDTIPYYVRYYLLQLRPHFERIIYIHNRKELSKESLDFLSNASIEMLMVDNEGYDFGMWYKGLKLTENYDRIALINDSCILFKNLNDDFKRIDELNADYTGMIISDRYATHLQSFFLIIGSKAIPLLRSYFNEKGIVNDYREVIQIYEIGLTQKMLASGMKVASLYNNSNRAFPKNPSFALVGELIDEGIPLIKKKIVFRNYRGLEYYWVVRMNFNTDYRIYLKQISSKYGNDAINFDLVMKDALRKSNTDVYLFSLARGMANALRAIPGMRWLFNQGVKIYKKRFRNK